MPTPRPFQPTLALSIALALALAPPQATAARKAKPPAIAPACNDFHAFANQDWLAAHAIVAGKGMNTQRADARGKKKAPGRTPGPVSRWLDRLTR